MTFGNGLLGFANFRYVSSQFLRNKTVTFHFCHEYAVVPLPVVCEKVLKPDCRNRMACNTVTEKHSGLIYRLAIFVTNLPPRVSKTCLSAFIFHWTVTWRVDVHRGIRIAFLAAAAGQNVIGHFAGSSQLPDNLRLVQRC